MDPDGGTDMGILKICIFLVLGLWAGGVYAQDELTDSEVLATAPLCSSTKEYTEVMKFLRTTQIIIFQEPTSRLIAEKVSRGCDGAAQRFREILTLLKGVGLSDAKSVEVALEFSAQSSDVQKNFLEVFSKSFLAEFFDYEYPSAIRLAYELSKDYKGSASRLREDFLSFVRFCKDSKNMDLPANLCSELAVKFARLSQYYPEGVRGPFDQLYAELRKAGTFGLDMKAALETSYNVLRHGPKASENFLQGVRYALSKEGLELSQQQAIEFGIKMAERSYRGEAPPVLNESSNLHAAEALTL